VAIVVGVNVVNGDFHVDLLPMRRGVMPSPTTPSSPTA
jgi:hypothetical protein